MHANFKKRVYPGSGLLNWAAVALLTGWVLILATAIEVNDTAPVKNTERTLSSIEFVLQETEQQLDSIYARAFNLS